MYILQPFDVSTTHTYEIIINATICATLVGWVERWKFKISRNKQFKPYGKTNERYIVNTIYIITHKITSKLKLNNSQ